MKNPDLGSIRPTCGKCDFWKREEDEDFGECCANPSVVVFLESEQDVASYRPSMSKDDLACRHFRGNN